MAQAQPGPAKVLEIWGPGNPELFYPQHQKNNILKIQICSAKNVGNVWISQKKTFPAPFGAIPGKVFHGPEKNKQTQKQKKLYIFLGGPMGPIHPVWGHVLVSFFSIF